jgi:peptide/nickel transport system substrate-binding protein
MIGFGIGGVVMGRVSDRFGVRVPLAIGSVTLGLGFVAAAHAPGLLSLSIIQGVLIGFLGTAGGFSPLIADASLWFNRRRGIAVAICASGNYLAGTVWPPIVQALAENWGWRSTYIGLGVFCLVTTLPLLAMFRIRAPLSDAGSVPVAGTGPYFFSTYDPNKGLTMSRNPHFKVWSEAAMPDGYPDVVQYDFGLTDEAEVTAVMNGEADWMFDQPPTDRLGEIGTKYKDQVYINTLTAWWYAPMNTRIAPFDNIKARQAVNYAIDRKALVNLFGGPVLAAPVCQVLPPGFPAHVAYCPYTKDPGEKWSAPDIEKAKQLVEESGTKGQKVTVIVEDTAVSKSIGVYLQSVLKEIGYDADLKPISPNIQFTYIQNTNNKVQISVSQWYQDYPAASNFLNVLFGCSSFTEGSDSSINIAGFCDEKVEAKMKEAFALAATDPEGANKIWTEIDRMVTDAAPAAPLFTPKHIDFVSKRLGNFQFNAQFYWMVTQSWVQ